MKIFPVESEVEIYEEGFEDDDILRRAETGKSLSRLVEQVEDPLVIAIDGRWGVGKSYFLKRWAGAHALQNDGRAKTVYFDAFANDYMSDPLVSLLSAIEARLPNSQSPSLGALKKAAYGLLKPAARVGLSVVTFGAKEALGDAGDVIAEAIGGEVANSVDGFWQKEAERQSAMKQFGDALKALVSDGDDEPMPLVVVVDELDRCRPDYALEVLEVIKHFFSVPNIHFVLGVNLNALEQSVVARYGINMDAEAYLRKFIDLNVSLPQEFGERYNRKSAVLTYLEKQLEAMSIPDHLANPLQRKLGVIAAANNASIRDVGKILTSVLLCHTAVRERSNWRKGWLEVLIELVISKTLRPDLYPKFIDCSISSAEFLAYYGRSASQVNEFKGGERNSEFDSELAYQYWIWRYLCGDPVFSSEDKEYQRSIKGLFDEWGGADGTSHIPAKVEKDWVDVLSFFGQMNADT